MNLFIIVISVLNYLDAVVDFYCKYGSIIVAGDLNASCLSKDLVHSNKQKSGELKQFVSKFELS